MIFLGKEAFSAVCPYMRNIIWKLCANWSYSIEKSRFFVLKGQNKFVFLDKKAPTRNRMGT